MALTAEDWRVLEVTAANPNNLEAELRRWIDAGYVSQEQAADLWDEVYSRIRSYQYNIPVKEAAERQAREAEEAERIRREREWAGRPLGAKMTPEAYTAYVQREEWRGARPEVDYGTAEEYRAGFEVPQTENWRDWFRSRYPRIIEQFEATQPEFKRESYPGLSPEEASKKREESWAAYFKRIKPQIKREWYNLSPYQRGERPSAYAPRIQTVGF